MFGVQFHSDDDIIQPLESQQLRRLYPANCDRKKELKKLNQSILCNFLDLLDVLIRAPESRKRTEKLDDLSLLFIHMHHLINEFRPHQARETLRVLLEQQQRQRLETTSRFMKHLEIVQERLQNCVESLPTEQDLDTKLVIPMQVPDTGAKAAAQENAMETEFDDGVDPVNRRLCEIIDNMTT